jgi:uncharacterized integral membrane protein (TIGR00697 family)
MIYHNELIFLTHALISAGLVVTTAFIGRNALIAYLCLLGIFANLFVLKTMTLFGLTATCSDVYMVGLVLGLNVLQEVWGKKSAVTTIYYSFGALLAYTAFSWLHLAYQPSPTDTFAQPYQTLLGYMPRLTAASLTSYFVTMQLDRWVYARLRLQWNVTALKASSLSMITSQTVDTVLFSILGLYGTVASLGSVIVVSLIIKAVTIAIMTPFMRLVGTFVVPKIDILE